MFFLIFDNAGILWYMIDQTGVMRKIHFIEEGKYCCYMSLCMDGKCKHACKYHNANTLSQDHCPDDIFKCIFLNGNVWLSIKNSLKFVPKCPINNISALVQIMAWYWPGNKPLSEPMMVNLLKYIWFTQPQWVKEFIHLELSVRIFYFRTEMMDVIVCNG